MFIDNKTEMHLGLLHLPEHVFQTRRVDNKKRRLQNVFKAKFPRSEQMRNQILAVDEADYIVE